MAREDTYLQIRGHLAELSDEQLEARFWELAQQVVDPLVELARTHTSPSIERSVLMRMGVDSPTCMAVVGECEKRGLLGHGAGHVVLRCRAGEWGCRRRGRAPARRRRGLGRRRRRSGEGRHERQPPARRAACRRSTPTRSSTSPALLEGLEHYRPRRTGWHWREQVPDQKLHKFVYKETSKGLTNSIPLPAAHYFDDIDPQPDCVVTTEIASGRFEDDIRRMRMAAWHGADHMMVIRTAGQSHMDGLLEGTPEGVGGIAVTRKQVRATRKALDLIEDEVGRPINFHSYVSGVAGPEMAVMFAEEGVNGAHQDPQYNVLYRNINMYRSFVDAAVAKHVMASVRMAQIDGAHNANATAVEAWKVMPELLVQHAINCAYSVERRHAQGGHLPAARCRPTRRRRPACAWTCPTRSPCATSSASTRCAPSRTRATWRADGRDATVSHVMNLMISRLTSADIQSTITPDEGRNVPWHYNNVAAVNTAKQSLVGMDGLREMVKLDREAPELKAKVRELKERAVLFLEAMLEDGGYFAAVEEAYFVDSGEYPETHDDGIARKADGGVAVGHHRRARRRLPGAGLPPLRREPPAGGRRRAVAGANAGKPCDLIGGCTLCDADKVPFIDELDPEDNVNARLAQTAELREKGLIKPEVEWAADGWVVVTLFLPAAPRVAEFAALEFGKAMNLQDCEVINKQVMHPAEGTLDRAQGPAGRGRRPGHARDPARARGDERRGDQGLRRPRRASSASPPPSARTSTRWACARSSTSSTAASRSGASPASTWAPRCRSRRSSTPPSSTPPRSSSSRRSSRTATCTATTWRSSPTWPSRRACATSCC